MTRSGIGDQVRVVERRPRSRPGRWPACPPGPKKPWVRLACGSLSTSRTLRPGPGERAGQVVAGRGLADPALLVQHRDDGHWSPPLGQTPAPPWSTCLLVSARGTADQLRFLSVAEALLHGGAGRQEMAGMRRTRGDGSGHATRRCPRKFPRETPGGGCRRVSSGAVGLQEAQVARRRLAEGKGRPRRDRAVTGQLRAFSGASSATGSPSAASRGSSPRMARQ